MANRKGDSDRRYLDPPKGFAVLREIEIDPIHGRPTRWMYRGNVNGHSFVRVGLRSHASACRAAWFIVDDLIARGETPVLTDIADADTLVADALARRHAVKVERLVESADERMPNWYRIERDTWAVMLASLLEQVVADAGSIRKAARLLNVPRSTLGAWVRKHVDAGTWPG